MVGGDRDSNRAGDVNPNVQALRASVTALEQRFDALSLDVQRILAVMVGEVNANQQPQGKEVAIGDAEHQPHHRDVQPGAYDSPRRAQAQWRALRNELPNLSNSSDSEAFER